MEGITGHIVRNAFFHNFGCIDKYFTPFVPAAKNLSKKLRRDLDPENNRGLFLVPQLLSNSSREVLDMIEQLKDLGYREFNLNLGCPSGTVAGKGRGSGFLRYPQEVDRFLDEIYSAADLPVSVKTRIGFSDTEEWPGLLDIYCRYPISELIIHPRLRNEFYKGSPHVDAFDHAMQVYEHRRKTEAASSDTALCYNGDIWDMKCYRDILDHICSEDCPKTACSKDDVIISANVGEVIDRVMIGRGLLVRPDLLWEISADGSKDQIADEAFIRSHIRNWHDEIYEGYKEIFGEDKHAMQHMKEIWGFLGRRFKDSDRLMKQLLKSQSPMEYRITVNLIFRELQLV